MHSELELKEREPLNKTDKEKLDNADKNCDTNLD